MKSSVARWATAGVFLCGAALLLLGARAFTGWGAGPGVAVGMLELRPSGAPGFGLLVSAGRLLSAVPFAGGVFGINAGAAVAGALAPALVFLICLRAGVSTGYSLYAAALFLFSPVVFPALADVYGAFVLLSVLATVFAWGEWGEAGDTRRFLLFVFVAALGGGLHPAAPLMGLLLVLTRGARRTVEPERRAAMMWGGVALCAAATAGLFFRLRGGVDLDWGGAGSAVLVQARETGIGQWMKQIANPSRLHIFLAWFAEAVTGRYLPVLIAAPAALLRRETKGWALLLFPFAAAAAFVATPHRDVGLMSMLAVFPLLLCGAMGLSGLAAAARAGRRRLARAAVWLWAAAALAAPLLSGGGLSAGPDFSAEYARGLLDQLPRDAVFVVRGIDPLHNVDALMRVEGCRRDVTMLRPAYFASPGYRELLRARWGKWLRFPSEGEYFKATKGVQDILGKNGAEAGEEYHKRMGEVSQFVVEGMTAEYNAVRRKVYFSSVGHFVESKTLVKGTEFEPRAFLFEMKTGERAVFDAAGLLALPGGGYAADATAARLMSRYYTDLGENFYRSAQLPRGKSDTPESAALRNVYKGYAARFLEKALSLDGGNPRAAFLMGLQHKEEGRYEEANAELTKTMRLLLRGSGVEDIPASSQMMMLGRVYQELGMTAEADRLFDVLER